MTEAFQDELTESPAGMIPIQRAEAKRVGIANRKVRHQHEMAGFLTGMQRVAEVSAQIAAAPDLLAALRKLVGTSASNNSPARIRKIALAAIARAGG
ncbi:hypothetical protein V5G24_04350 [Xanthobacter sp. VTT E-85241]|uniref:hypothetical protein n=1 Tax=Roseixanthobacter finlandensis TaxID=3119922 RepID=UPI003727A981